MKNNFVKVEQEARHSSRSITDLKIMMVDDEPTTIGMVKAYLEDFGYRRFVQVEDPARALQFMEESNPDIILLDLIMPDVSGFDILLEVRKHPKFNRLPIIILTSSIKPEDKLRALDLGATDFLAKPVDPSELCLRVRNTLAAKEYSDHLTFYDSLTGLPNRHMFLDRCEWALKKAKRYGEELAVMNIALDNFDRVNATFGTRTADNVLCQIADRIRGAIRNVDILGHGTQESEAGMNLFRIEGSSFSLLLERIHGEESAAIVAERIIREIRKPLQADGKDIYVKASIGIATYPTESDDVELLLTLASSAMDYIKNKGGDSFQFSTSTINELYSNRRSIETLLRKAIEKDEFILQFQPKVDVGTNVIKGVETLLRWRPDENKFIPPDVFIPVAEETGLITPIGEWILNKAISQLEEWNETETAPIGMSINLSARQFQNKEFFSIVKRIVDGSSVDPRLLTLEITESLLMEDVDHAIKTLKQFRELGLILAIDDFGTGYSSFNYLSELPVDELKIDRSFIVNLSRDSKNVKIFSTIIYLARNLGLTTVAEGVETEAQLQHLREIRCDQYQGFLFSQPLTDIELYKLLPRKT